MKTKTEMLKFDHDLLEAKIKAAGETHASLARLLGMSKTNMSSIWNDRQPWQLKHIAPIALRLELSPEDVWDIFFRENCEVLADPRKDETE